MLFDASQISTYFWDIFLTWRICGAYFLSHHARSWQGLTTVYDKRQQPPRYAATITSCRKATTVDFRLHPFTISEIYEWRNEHVNDKQYESNQEMPILRQTVCNPKWYAKVLQRGLSGGSQASQNGTEEQPLQSRPTTHGDTASGVSHLFQSCHAHGLFPAVRL